MEPTDVMKEKAVRVICYEIKMFRWSANWVAENVPPSQKPSQKYNAIVESFVMHTRTLIDFFYNDPRSDDVVARHYVAAWEPPHKTTHLSEAIEKANKQLAHITYSRVDDTRYADPDKKPWNFEKISSDLEKTITLFFNSLPKDYRDLFSKQLST